MKKLAKQKGKRYNKGNQIDGVHNSHITKGYHFSLIGAPL